MTRVAIDIPEEVATRRKAAAGDRILPVTVEVAQTWGALGGPDAFPVMDGLVAATALLYDLTPVTRNTLDIEQSGARTLNPWRPIDS
jgi:hypothetical protein